MIFHLYHSLENNPILELRYFFEPVTCTSFSHPSFAFIMPAWLLFLGLPTPPLDP
jgi:hypothetical protein